MWYALKQAEADRLGSGPVPLTMMVWGDTALYEEINGILFDTKPELKDKISIHQKGLPCGVASGYAPGDIQDKWNGGADWFVFSQDVRILSGAYKANLEAIKKSVVVSKN